MVFHNGDETKSAKKKLNFSHALEFSTDQNALNQSRESILSNKTWSVFSD
jgi:hypothetical protein